MLDYVKIICFIKIKGSLYNHKHTTMAKTGTYLKESVTPHRIKTISVVVECFPR